MSKPPGNRPESDDERCRERPPWRSASAADPIAAEIQAEIADHLATATEQLQSQGLATDEARQKSQAKFGDPAAIGRRCYWIKQGDALMFRTAVIALLAMLCLALGFATFSSYRTQRQMAEQMTALAEQLKELAEQKIAAPAHLAEEPKLLEIIGRAFIGSPDKPAANTRISIIDVKDASYVRSVETDSQGNFNSGPLGGGDYSLLAHTADRSPGGRFGNFVQAAPIGVYPGVPVPRQELDVSYPLGGLWVELSQALPSRDVDGRFAVDSRLMIRVKTTQHRSYPWTTEMEPPLAWPVYPHGDLAATPSSRGTTRRSDEQAFYDLLNNDRIQQRFSETEFGALAGRLPEGKVEVTAAILIDALPIGYTPQPIPDFDSSPDGRSKLSKADSDVRDAYQAWNDARNNLIGLNKPVSLQSSSPYRSNAFSITNDSFYWLTKGLGNVWLTHLQESNLQATSPRPHLVSSVWLAYCENVTVPIQRGKTTRLRIEVPDDLVSQVQAAVDATSDPKEFEKVVLEHSSRPWVIGNVPRTRGTPESNPFFRPVKISVAEPGP